MARSDVTSPNQAGPSPAKKLAASGARYGCFGRWTMLVRHQIGEGPLEEVLLLQAEQLVPGRQGVGEVDDIPVEERESVPPPSWP